MDLMGFHPAALFVHLRNNSQMPGKLMTTKKQSGLGLLRQTAKIGSYRRGWTQLSWGTIPSRNSTEKQQMIESTAQLKAQTQFKRYQLKIATGNLRTEFIC